MRNSPPKRPRRRPGCEGLLLLPYLEGERTPNVPDGTGVWFGVNQRTFVRRILPARRWKA